MAYRVREADADGRPVGGVDLPAGRFEPGDTIEGDVPRWLVTQGYVERIEAKPAKTKKGA